MQLKLHAGALYMQLACPHGGMRERVQAPCCTLYMQPREGKRGKADHSDNNIRDSQKEKTLPYFFSNLLQQTTMRVLPL